jgi:hypothetical protein
VSSVPSAVTTPQTAEQYLRNISLIVYNNALKGIDLSALRIKFSVKRSDTQTPNFAEIRVYNVAQDTAMQIFSAFSPGTIDAQTGLVTNKGRVILQAGYGGNQGIIFNGNIKQIILGRESATDTFIDIMAGDGDRAYNFAIVNTTIRTPKMIDQLNAAAAPMAPFGTTIGDTGTLPTTQLPRGKVMYGQSKNYMRNIAKSTGQAWSIQNEKLTFIPLKSYLPGTALEINAKTGMIGTPQQTNEGVNLKCLLNPMINVGTAVKLDNKSIARYKINLSVPLSPANIPAPINADGIYYVLVCEHSGDTRGIEWYSSLVTLNIDVTTNPANQVQINYGGNPK